jgi:MFS family permease
LLTATAFSAFCDDYVSLIVYCASFGFTIGAYVGLTSVILVDLLGLEKLTNAFGLLLLFQGIASLVGPPIAGNVIVFNNKMYTFSQVMYEQSYLISNDRPPEGQSRLI